MSIPVTPDRHAYDLLCADTLTRRDPEFIHQHVVDAFAAQYADESTKPIALTFALVGLYLHVERGFSGRKVQLAHMKLARWKGPWPTLPLPPGRGGVTPTDVLRAAPGAERDRAIHAWCTSVWEAFRVHRSTIANLVREHGVAPLQP